MAKKRKKASVRKSAVAARDAEYGSDMIEVKLRFWTNNISETKGQLVPKHAWAAGNVRVEPNDAHGIKPRKPEQFHTLLDIGAAIEKVLIEHGIVIHPSRKMSKYSPKPNPRPKK